MYQFLLANVSKFVPVQEGTLVLKRVGLGADGSLNGAPYLRYYDECTCLLNDYGQDSPDLMI